MKLEIINGDVFDCSADALVFSASKKPVIGGNFDGLVFSNANSEKLLAERRKIGEIQSGNAEITKSFGLKGYKYLIHTVMPNYNNHHYNSSERLRNCYVNSLAVAEKKNIKSVVFPVLGGGCAKFPSSYAKELAIEVLSEYTQTHTESCIEKITLVLYNKKEEYSNFVAYNGYIRKLSELNIPYKYLNKDSSMCKRMNHVSDKIIEQCKVKTDKIYLQYQQELRDFQKQLDNGQNESIYQSFNDKVYHEIINKYKNMTNEELAGMINVNDASNISKSLTLKNNFLKDRYNVIRLGLGLKLPIDDFCRLMFSRGHIFPENDLDYTLITYYIEQGDWEYALDDFEYELKHEYILKEKTQEMNI